MRDFSQDKNRDAACKNAFVLLGQHRPELAAAFFVLGGMCVSRKEKKGKEYVFRRQFNGMCMSTQAPTVFAQAHKCILPCTAGCLVQVSLHCGGIPASCPKHHLWLIGAQ